MKRILIIGSGGAGKSTFSKQLAKILNIPIIHLDVHFWNPGWVMTDSEIWHKTVDNLILGDSWIMDGNFNSTIEKRVKRADTVFYFDFSKYRCLYNAIKRMIIGRYFFKKRSDMAEGCKEKFDMEFYKWIWNFNKDHREEYYKMLNDLKAEKNVYIIRSYREKKKILKQLRIES
ncbi:MAG: topology modulation protein [Candidatus Delongbacteria bacterium]|nr:topology modulation protein [Candidatus Delongbacteria bacterium]